MVHNELYIFDLDETLLNGDCVMLWHQFLVKQGIIKAPHFLQEDARLMALYSHGKLDMQQYLNFSIAPITNLPMQQIAALVEQFIHTDIGPNIFNQALQLIHQLQQQNQDIIIISASVDFLVAKIAQHLTIKHHLAIDLHIKNNCYSASIKGIASYQEGKVIRLQVWLQQQKKHYQTLNFYTDSINDLSLCEYADNVYVVNPCSQLAHIAQLHSWPQLNWS